MNTISKYQILEADRLATIYAGELRGKGYTPSTSLAVTPDKVMRLEFQNGELNKITLPVGKLADWVKTFENETFFDVEFHLDGMILRHDGSMARLHPSNDADTLKSLMDVPPIRFDDKGGSQRAFQLVTPADIGDISSKIKSNRQAAQFDKVRQKEIGAKRALKVAAQEHCARLAIVAQGPDVAQARRKVKELRMFRAALQNPQNVISWLGESITPAGEYDAGPVTNLTPDHFDRVAAILSARAAVAGYKPRMMKSKWGGEKTPQYGKAFEKLGQAVTDAEKSLTRWIESQFDAECKANNLGDIRYKFARRSEFSKTRALLRKTDWPAAKWMLSQDYVKALDARRKLESKLIADGVLIRAKAIHADGQEKFDTCTPGKLNEYKERALEKGAKLFVLVSNNPAVAVGAVDLAPLPAEIMASAETSVAETSETQAPVETVKRSEGRYVQHSDHGIEWIPGKIIPPAKPERLRVQLPSAAEISLGKYINVMGQASVELCQLAA